MTTICFIGHSKTQKTNKLLNSYNFQLQNEKQILSIEVEELVSTILNIEKSKNIDINIIETFGERKFGVNPCNKTQDKFYEKQVYIFQKLIFQKMTLKGFEKSVINWDNPHR